MSENTHLCRDIIACVLIIETNNIGDSSSRDYAWSSVALSLGPLVFLHASRQTEQPGDRASHRQTSLEEPPKIENWSFCGQPSNSRSSIPAVLGLVSPAADPRALAYISGPQGGGTLCVLVVAQSWCSVGIRARLVPAERRELARSSPV